MLQRSSVKLRNYFQSYCHKSLREQNCLKISLSKYEQMVNERRYKHFSSFHERKLKFIYFK